MAFNVERFDQDKFAHGTWTEIMGGQFKVCKAGSAAYEKALEANGYRKKKDPAAKEKALLHAVAEGILVDWADIQDANGQEVPYTVENCARVLGDNPDLVAEVLQAANDLDLFRKEDVEEQRGKLSAG